ncbi:MULTISPECIES: glycosyltransferase family 4 protein [Winogradskyella]|uniref:glycosyltransferase family 4 protein n=1 Tax=Winogradskyella TaxID=286104 RepID=UPI0015CAD99D|nr:MULTISPECIES: glycosyltransferase family 4 protein [Winogradskyella]QXP78219.1 glycosyltransferase family 4 protein [Winogradskyella sp. HaHa_3_26]
MAKTDTHSQTIGIVLSSVPGYSETFFRNKIKGLQEHGFRVILFVDYINPDDASFSCKVVSAPHFSANILSAIWSRFFALLKLIFIHPKRTYNLFQLNKKDGLVFKENMRCLILNHFFLDYSIDWLHFGFGMLAVKRENIAEAMGSKMAVSFRGFDLYLSPLKHHGCYDVLFKKAIDYHVLSQEMKQDLISQNIASKHIHVITPAIDTEFFTSHKKRVFTDTLELITVARLHWKKGLEYTFEALADLKQQGVDFHYTIIGDGIERERLVFAAYQLDILDNITFAGKLPHDQVQKTLEKASIYLQYSIQEGFCNAVLEAQSMGLLCIVSDAEGLGENVLDGKTGWVVPKRQPKVLAQKINDVHHLSIDEKEKIITTAKYRVKSIFNLEQQNQAFINFYENKRK